MGKTMITYPKIESLFNRSKTNFKVTNEFRQPEFSNVKNFLVTEKIHGQNIRIDYRTNDLGILQRNIRARSSDNPNDVHKDLIAKLEELFSLEKLTQFLGDRQSVTFFGEGYGAGIQKEGINYNTKKDFVLFDVLINDEYFLYPEVVKEIAVSLGLELVPDMGAMTTDAIVELVRAGFPSLLATHKTGINHKAEGIVAIAPGLFDRRGNRIIFKLKTEDFLSDGTFAQPDALVTV